MTVEQYEQLMEALEGRVEKDEYFESLIMNLYYDTPDYMLIRRSIEKPVYKEKFRLRSYGVPTDDSQVFMEIKKKFKGVVYKRRVRANTAEAVNYMAGGPEPEVNDPQIMEEIHWFCTRYPLQPGMLLAYDRLAWKAVDDPNLRITFDTNIRYRMEDMDMTHGDYGTYLLPDNLVLMEVKIPGAAPMWLSHMLSDLEIFPTSFSKYGRCYLKEMEKKHKEQMEVNTRAS